MINPSKLVEIRPVNMVKSPNLRSRSLLTTIFATKYYISNPQTLRIRLYVRFERD